MSLAAPVLVASRPRGEALAYDLAPHALALATFALCAFSPAIFNDGDTFTHIAAGDWMLAHRTVPHFDILTYSFAGKPWTAHEWLSEILLAVSFRAGAFLGVALLTAAAAAVAVFIVTRVAARDLGGPGLAIVGVLSVMLIAPGALARPHILALPVFALWAATLLGSRDRPPSIYMSLLMTLWANLHGGFAFGLALIAPCAIESIVTAREKGRLFRDWALFALASIAAALVNPYGIEGLLFPIRLLGLQALTRIGEWGPETFAHPNALEAAILALIGVALFRPLRLSAIRLALLICLLHLSLAHARHEILLAVIGPMLLAKPLAEALGAPQKSAHMGQRTAAVLTICIVLSVVRCVLPEPTIPAYVSTQAALAALPTDAKREPVLNGYAFGGYLAFMGVRPYIDGRADLFGDSFLTDYTHIARGDSDQLAAALAQNRIGWTMFAPDQGATARLDALPGWRRVYTDPRVVVHVRTGL